jgi:hypothetical protein
MIREMPRGRRVNATCEYHRQRMWRHNRTVPIARVEFVLLGTRIFEFEVLNGVRTEVPRPRRTMRFITLRIREGREKQEAV